MAVTRNSPMMVKIIMPHGREISIQKRLRLQHVVELVCSYELKGEFFALFWPVAPFNLCMLLHTVQDIGRALNQSKYDGDTLVKDFPKSRGRNPLSTLACISS